jgi:hypothetical protein
MQPSTAPPAFRSASPGPRHRDDDPVEPPGDAGEADPFEELGDLLDRAYDADDAPFDGIVTI